VPRTNPSPAVAWLIAELARRDIATKPWTIERVRQSGLCPQPLHHRSKTLDGAELWPSGAVEHYAAALPLLKQRHKALEVAAITMAGWGYPVAISLLRQSYALAFGVTNSEARVSGLVDYYKKTGIPVFTTGLRHIRERHQDSGLNADELAAVLIGSSLSFMQGVASPAQVRKVMAAGAPPGYDKVSETAIAWLTDVFVLLQQQCTPELVLASIEQASTEDFVRLQPVVEEYVTKDFGRFGGFDEYCKQCSETRGFMIGLAIPWYLHGERFDTKALETLLQPLVDRMPTELNAPTT
jgi:hypothetical protein